MTQQQQNNKINPSTAGYTGAFFIVYGAFYFAFTDKSMPQHYQFLVVIFITFLAMLIHEYIFNPNLFHHRLLTGLKHSKFSYQTNIYKSAFYRYLAYLVLIFIPYFIIQNHYFFITDIFTVSRVGYTYIFLTVLFFGYPYILFTLRTKGSYRYDFGDYAIILMLFIRLVLLKYYYHFPVKLLTNRRFKKLLLVMIVNFFFLSLMFRFGLSQFTGFSIAIHHLISAFPTASFHDNFHNTYLVFYHLFFIVDIGVAIVGYTVASRWLDNRTRSVDDTLLGWLLALMCYPPFSSSFSANFINYSFAFDPNFQFTNLVYEVAMVFILVCYFIYVWATCTLGFKFSNLTNRGIVSHGAFSVIRHPAYLTKNLAWWIDNLYLFTNFWGAIAMLCGNTVYFMRAITEEKHLLKDRNYQIYKDKVKYRFIPKII